jgi:hypothetical protein
VPRVRWEYAILIRGQSEHQLSAPRAGWEDAGFPVPSGDSVITSTLRGPFVALLNRLGQCGWDVMKIDGDQFYLRRPEPDAQITMASSVG